MLYGQLGKSGVKVSRLCLGTMNFGTATTEREALRLLSQAYNAGINFIDTANVYGLCNFRKIGAYGNTEKIIGKWLKENRENRSRIVLATKVYDRIGNDPNDAGLSAYAIKRECEASLRRLGTDHIDLYQMHHIDRSVPWVEILETLEQLKREGKILYIGSSNFAGWDISTSCLMSQMRNISGLVTEQCRYNLMCREVEREVIPACKYFNMGILCYSPLNDGLLGGKGKFSRLSGRRSLEHIKERMLASVKLLESWFSFVEKHNASPSAMAIAWLLHQPIVSAVVIGPRTAGQVYDSISALSISLSKEDLSELDLIFKPLKTSPEYFAW